MNLQGKVALITGTRRIGGVVAQVLAKHGADVALVYRHSHAEALAAAQKVEHLGRKAMTVQANLSQAAEVQSLVNQVVQQFGGVDILINLASGYRSFSFEEMTEKDWSTELDNNLKSVFLCSQAVVPSMRQRGGGRIINFADWIAASRRPRYKGFLAYYVSKVGVVGLTEALALELAPQILVNAIAPGPILPPPGLTEKENQEILNATPLGRWGGEMEIAKTVVSLVESDFITGECIRVDGGRHIR
jgi:NAD(P)-dependent dehydrogenase (short-subunit alcohol dehydrogenase family)